MASEDRPPAPPETPTLDEVVAAIDRGAGDGEQAAAAAAPEPDAATERHIVFSLADTRCAAAVGNVVEIGLVPEVTFVPNVPAWVRGVANLRGEIVAVLDLRRLLDLEDHGRPGGERMLTVRSGEEDVTAGLVVDGIHGVAGISGERLAPPTAPVADRLAPYLRGVTEHQERVLAVLDLETLLLSEEVRRFEAL